jgi:hypothetical protein
MPLERQATAAAVWLWTGACVVLDAEDAWVGVGRDEGGVHRGRLVGGVADLARFVS